MRRQVLGFYSVGALSTLVHVAVAMVANSTISLPALLSNFSGYLAAVSISYLGHSKFTFATRAIHRTHLPRFLAVSFGALLLSSLITHIGHSVIGCSFLFTMLLVAVAVPFLTFLLLKFWVFLPGNEAPATRPDHISFDRFDKIVQAICVVVILLGVAGNFIYLDGSSFWLDELFTAYFADPEVATFAAFVERASEDVHPIGYYFLVWVVTSWVPGEFDIVARGLSAGLTTVLVPLLYYAFPFWVGRTARLLGCAMVVTSIMYFEYSQEARSYAMLWLPVTLMTGLALRVSQVTTDKAPLKSSTPFVIFFLGVVSSLIHYYSLPIFAAFLLVLMAQVGLWRDRVRLAFVGLSILSVMMIYIDWQLEKVVVNTEDTWFEATPKFLLLHLIGGIRIQLGVGVQYGFSMFLWLVGFLALNRTLAQQSTSEAKVGNRQVALLIRAFAMSIVLAVAITIFYRPSFSYRFFVALAPVFWILAGILFEAILRVYSTRVSTAIILITLAALVFDTTRLAWRDLQRKEPWAASAQYVDTLRECNGQVLPVGWLEQPHITGNAGLRFYGYYLQDLKDPQWSYYSWDGFRNLRSNPGTFEILDDRVRLSDACPLLFWTMEKGFSATNEKIASSVSSQFSLGKGQAIEVRSFEVKEETLLRRMLGLAGGNDERLVVIVVVRSGE